MVVNPTVSDISISLGTTRFTTLSGKSVTGQFTLKAHTGELLIACGAGSIGRAELSSDTQHHDSHLPAGIVAAIVIAAVVVAAVLLAVMFVVIRSQLVARASTIDPAPLIQNID